MGATRLAKFREMTMRWRGCARQKVRRENQVRGTLLTAKNAEKIRRERGEELCRTQRNFCSLPYPRFSLDGFFSGGFRRLGRARHIDLESDHYRFWLQLHAPDLFHAMLDQFFRVRTSAAVAPPRFTMARACLLEMPTWPKPYPRANPDFSTSHAAETFLFFSSAG